MKVLFGKRLEGMEDSRLMKMVVKKLRGRRNRVGKSMRFLGESLNRIMRVDQWVN